MTHTDTIRILLAALFLTGSHAFGQSLSLRGSVTVPPCTAVDAVGPEVLTATATNFIVVDASNPSAPSVQGQIATQAGSITAIAANGDYAYCAAQNTGLVVVNIADPTLPTITTRFSIANSVHGVDATDTLVAVATTATVLLIGVRAPAHPHILASYGHQGSWVQFDPAGGRLHVGSSTGTFDLTIVVSTHSGDTTFSLVNHHSYGAAPISPLAVVGPDVDAANGASLIALNASDYGYLGQYQAGAAIRAVTGLPGFAFIAIATGTVTMLDQRRGLPESPISVGIPSVPTGIALGQSGNQHIVAVSHDAGISILAYDTSNVSAEPPRALPSDFSLTVFPNPFNSVARIQITAPEPGRYALTIYDVLGREVQHETLMISTLTNWTVDFSRCAPGVYFARVSNPARAMTAKLLYLP